MSTFTQFIGGRLQSQTFNSSGTFTAPASVNNVWISMSGGGGGSGDSATNASGIATGGGAGAWCAKIPVAVTPGANYTVTVGAGGASAQSSNVYGGTSSFGNLISRVGGLCGSRYYGGSNWIGAGGGSAMGGAYLANAGSTTWYMPAGSVGGAISGQGIYAGAGGYFGNGANSGSGGDGGDNVANSGYSGKVIVEWIA